MIIWDATGLGSPISGQVVPGNIKKPDEKPGETHQWMLFLHWPCLSFCLQIPVQVPALTTFHKDLYTVNWNKIFSP